MEYNDLTYEQLATAINEMFNKQSSQPVIKKVWSITCYTREQVDYVVQWIGGWERLAEAMGASDLHLKIMGIDDKDPLFFYVGDNLSAHSKKLKLSSTRSMVDKLETQDPVEDWLKDRPECIKQAALEKPPGQKYSLYGKECYIISYEEPESGRTEDVTVTVQKTGRGKGMTQFTNKVFGVKLGDLIPWKDETNESKEDSV